MKPTILFKTLLAAGALIASNAAQAQLFTNTLSYTVNLAIPDNDLNGVSDTRTVVSQIFSITDVRVTLIISGGFNGDYYAYLTHGSGFAVLLNFHCASFDFGAPNDAQDDVQSVKQAERPCHSTNPPLIA